MAKKKKFKLTGQLKAQLLSQSVKTTDGASSGQEPFSNVIPSQPIDQKPVAKTTSRSVDPHVLVDIKRICFVVGTLTIILIAIAILDSRIHLSLTIGQNITRVLGI